MNKIKNLENSSPRHLDHDQRSASRRGSLCRAGSSHYAELAKQGIALNITVKTETIKEIPKEQIDSTISLIRENYKLESDASAFYGTAIIMQKGGCNSNKNTNIVIEMQGSKLESKTIGGFIRTKCKNASPRQFCRQIADQIFEIAKHSKTPGNLKVRLEKQYTKQWNEIQDPDKEYWASDFQSSNPNCPDGIKFLIRQNYQETFSKQQKK